MGILIRGAHMCNNCAIETLEDVLYFHITTRKYDCNEGDGDDTDNEISTDTEHQIILGSVNRTRMLLDD